MPDLAKHPPHVADLVSKLLDKLDDASRWIIQARYGLEPLTKALTVKEIAAQLGLTHWQVYHRLHEIIARLRAIAESLDDDFVGGA